MWIKRANRRELAEILQNQRSTSVINALETEQIPARMFSLDDVDLVWKYDPARNPALPSVCVSPRQLQNDLFAWVNTYVANMRPLTAFCQVVDPAFFDQLLASQGPPFLGQFQDAVMSLTLVETASYLGTKRDLKNLTPQSCFTTLSFSIGRAMALGVPVELLMSLPDRWIRARQITGGTLLSPSPASLKRAWSVLGLITPRVNNLFNKPLNIPIWDPPHPVILRACEELNSTGIVSQATWEHLSRGMKEVIGMREKLQGPKDGRVSVLEAGLRELSFGPVEPDIGSFFAAFLANAISPGSLEHLWLLFPLTNVFPDVLPWYGLLAGISPQSAVLNSANGVGRKVLRELLRPRDLLDPPLSDISFEELEVLNRSSKSIAELRLGSSNFVSVELVHGVNTMFRLGRIEEPAANPNLEAIDTVNDLDRHLEQANRAMTKLKNTLGVYSRKDSSPKKNAKRRSESDY